MNESKVKTPKIVGILFTGLVVAVAFLAALFARAEVAKAKPNVLLIIVDDLRTELNCYGVRNAITPNIDRLAAQGVTFLNAYCQKAVCVPSRQSFLTGMRPNEFGAEFNTRFRTKLPNAVTLPQQFGRNGYQTRSMGKVFHHRDDQSWDEPSWIPEPELCYPVYATEQNLAIQKIRIAKKQYGIKGQDWWAKGGKWVPASIWEAPDVEDNALTDGKIADHAINTMKELRDEPFFMAVGFFRPHLPFIAPKKYYDLYPLATVALPSDPDLPKGSPSFTAQRGGEWRSYHNVAPGSQMPDEKTRKEYIRGYLASVSYVDAQIGRVLRCLTDLGLEKKTIVILMGDHGYHLFDKESFGKCTNFENATRVPLLVRWPGAEHKGVKSKAVVELLDIYPTLCDLAGISVPEQVQGQSFRPAFGDPDWNGKESAYSQFKKGGYQGYSVRTKRYRLTEWTNESQQVRELYDYKNDPEETVNIIGEQANEKVVKELKFLLDRTFRSAKVNISKDGT